MNKYKDYFLDPAYLKGQLSNEITINDVTAYRNILSQICQASEKNEHLLAVFPEMVKLIGHSDIVVRKIACGFLTKHAHAKPELSILAINSLLNFLTDSNPIIRALAAKTFCSMNHESFHEHSSKSVIKALDDKSAYVRRVAVMCCIRLQKTIPSFITDFGVVNKLYSMLRDADPVVIVNALSVLDEILEEEGGIIINKKIAYHLLNQISLFTAWGRAYTLKLLKRYTPKTEEEVFAVLNILDSFLAHSECCVVTNSIELFMSLVTDLPHLKLEVFKRSKDSLLLLLNSENMELKHYLVLFLRNNIEYANVVFSDHYQSFFCKNNESLFLKKEKIAILPYFVNDENIDEILDELGLYIIDNRHISLEASEAVSAIIKQRNEFTSQCFSKLHNLCQMDYDYVFSNVIKTLQNLKFDTYSKFSDFLSLIISKHNLLDSDNKEGRCAFLYLIGQYGHLNSESVYTLEKFMNNIENENSSVLLSLLTASVKIFLHQPAKMQELLGSVLEHCVSCNDREVEFQACYYYSLLKTDIHNLKKVLTISM